MNETTPLGEREIHDILHQALRDTPIVELPEGAFSPALRLMGREGLLDSLSCMLFMVNVDRLVSEKTGRPVELVSDFNFTEPGNPFDSVASLTRFIAEAMKDKAGS